MRVRLEFYYILLLNQAFEEVSLQTSGTLECRVVHQVGPPIARCVPRAISQYQGPSRAFRPIASSRDRANTQILDFQTFVRTSS